MSITERSEILSRLYKAQTELGCIYDLCRETRAVRVGAFVQVAQNNVNEAIDEFKPDSPAPQKMEFARRKFDHV
jgi:hypothetical protein